MDPKKAKQVKLSLDRFFYKVRFNIGFHTAVNSDAYKSFYQKMERGIGAQVLYFSKVDKINQIVGVRKAVREITEMDLLPKIILLWIPIAKFVEEHHTRSYLTDMAELGGQTGLDKLGSELDFDLKDPTIIKNIDRQIETMMTQVDETTQSWIARTIEQGLNEKASHVQIAKTLRDAAPEYASMRSSVISENEALSMMATVEHEVFKRNNLAKYRWITSRDESVCPICLGNEEQGLIQLGTLFSSGAIIPPAHQRCRCFIQPNSEELEITWTG